MSVTQSIYARASICMDRADVGALAAMWVTAPAVTNK